jgi:hypothetical protein
MDIKSQLKKLKSNWTLLAQAAAGIVLTIKGFVSPPVYFDPIADTAEIKNLAVFIVIILVGIFIYLGQIWSSKKYAKVWAIVTPLLLVVLVASTLKFSQFKATCTCSYGDQILLIGKRYTPEGERDALKYLGTIPCNEILMNFAGRANRIWTEESINSCKHNLELAYLLTFSMAALSILSVLQIIKCLETKKQTISPNASTSSLT